MDHNLDLHCVSKSNYDAYTAELEQENLTWLWESGKRYVSQLQAWQRMNNEGHIQISQVDSYIYTFKRYFSFETGSDRYT